MIQVDQSIPEVQGSQVLQSVHWVLGILGIQMVLSILQGQVLRGIQLVLVVQQDQYCLDFLQVQGNQVHLCRKYYIVEWSSIQ